MTTEQGCLYLVGTPIGNLEDVTARALRTLAEADVVACEDTRRTLQLLNHFNLTKRVVSYHEHNSRAAGQRLLSWLLEGKTVALVTDAGMPVISDPGADLVALAAEAGCPVTVVPGPCAVSSALALSAMAGGRYAFEGFLPREGKPRRLALEALAREERTIVLYEAPHRLVRTLSDLLGHLGDRQVAVCKDMTKLFERVDRVTLSQAIALFESQEPRGEYALVVAGAPAEAAGPADWEALSVPDHVRRAMAEGLSKKDAIKRVAHERGVPKNDVYALVIDIDS